jgi:hypothetical protein
MVCSKSFALILEALIKLMKENWVCMHMSRHKIAWVQG